MRSYPDYFYNVGKLHFVFCKCRKHENIQDWLRVNYDPSKGLLNIDIMNDAIGADHVQINSIRVKESTQSQQRFGIADIEELSQSDNGHDSM